MNSDNRRDPDAILKAIAEGEKKSQEAKLRIFLGMSAGVGKTYSMLKAAHQRFNEGIDVVIGAVETHGRLETAALVQGLPLIPSKNIIYRDTQLQEMDLDEILKLKPKLVIVDELAHTNAPGSRHEKRYQDVIELLDAGIDVYTALNVQHLESRKDSVEAITEISIRETVPDSLLERATLVELVDIAPTELLRRLREGKVYTGEKANRAAQNFFKEDRLTALREIALRITAEKVDHDLQQMGQNRNDANVWQTNERLLVAISHSPYSEKLIRATRRLAYNLESPWIAVHVDMGLTLDDKDQAQLTKNLNLARELKAEVITTTEVDVPSAVRRICRQKNVTQVVVGRPTKRWFRDVIEGGSLLNRLVSETPEVDIHVIRQTGVLNEKPSLKKELSLYKSQSGPIKYWYTFCFLALISVGSGFLEGIIGYRAVGFIFLLAVLVVGMFGSIGAVIFSATLSALTWNFLFIPPRLTFAISSVDDMILCFSFFVVAIIVGFLTNRIRFHERLIREREERTNFLYEVLRDIANSYDKAEFLTKVTGRVGKLLNAHCGVVLKILSGELKLDQNKDYGFILSEKEQAVALWSFQNQKNAGWGTDTLAESESLYIPLKGHTESLGVFIFKPLKRSRKLGSEQEDLLFSITRQLSLSIERHFLSKRVAETQRLKDSEELHQTLLNSISHELRTPLTAILGTASALDNEKLAHDPVYLKSVSQNLQEAGDRLNRVIENLLDMSRLSSGVLSLKLEWHDFSDLIGVVVKKNSTYLKKHQLKVNGLSEIALVKIDFRLLEHALSNILLNAALYTPENSLIEVKVTKVAKKIILEVKDNGPGIPEDSVSKIFDKFYRVPGSPTGGTGLGLSIVKSIIELHKGEIRFTNQNPHGACFRIELPMDESPSMPTEIKDE
ncbi:MAG: sensor histidine kinase KdpD [Bdellovibrio sp.]|nr:sensor histidine kinase KdpD [Bdellovibrio sp.]